jgi:hypothetical protein
VHHGFHMAHSCMCYDFLWATLSVPVSDVHVKIFQASFDSLCNIQLWPYAGSLSLWMTLAKSPFPHKNKPQHSAVWLYTLVVQSPSLSARDTRWLVVWNHSGICSTYCCKHPFGTWSGYNCLPARLDRRRNWEHCERIFIYNIKPVQVPWCIFKHTSTFM